MKNKKTEYHCPGCQNEKIIEFDDLIHCPNCNLDFDQKFLSVIPDDEILSQQELRGVLDIFTNEERRKLFGNEL